MFSLGAWVPGSLGPWFPGPLGPRVRGSLGPRVPGSLAPGSQGPWAPVSLGPWSQGPRAPGPWAPMLTLRRHLHTTSLYTTGVHTSRAGHIDINSPEMSTETLEVEMCSQGNNQLMVGALHLKYKVSNKGTSFLCVLRCNHINRYNQRNKDPVVRNCGLSFGVHWVILCMPNEYTLSNGNREVV